MQRRHGARLDGAAAGRKPAPLREVVASPKSFDKSGEFGEIVAVVGVAHDDERAARGGNSTAQRVAVALQWDIDHPSAELTRDVLRAISAPVVGNDDFTTNTCLTKR